MQYVFQSRVPIHVMIEKRGLYMINTVHHMLVAIASASSKHSFQTQSRNMDESLCHILGRYAH